MLTISLQVDNLANAKLLAAMLSRLDFVKDVNLENPKKKNKSKSLTNKDWILPGRPATDEEIEQMCLEMEKDTGEYTTEEVINFVSEDIKEWGKKKK